jgi:hypothetical protein
MESQVAQRIPSAEIDDHEHTLSSNIAIIIDTQPQGICRTLRFLNEARLLRVLNFVPIAIVH